MTFTKEQLTILSAYESHFRTAVNANWARNPGSAGLKVIWQIYTSATGDSRNFNDNCSTCIVSLLRDCGKLYFSDIEKKATEQSTTKEVKVSPMSKKAVKKATIKTKK